MKSNFQIIFLVVFVAIALVGVLTFAGAIKIGGGGGSGNTGNIKTTLTMWGTIDSLGVNNALASFRKNNNLYNIDYLEIKGEDFNQKLIESQLKGPTPDLFLLPNDILFGQKDKIYKTPLDNYPMADYRKNFISASDIFLDPDGIIAFPLAVDPFVMYYNRSILDNNSIISLPKYWDEFEGLVKILTKREENPKIKGDYIISQSAFALGQSFNISNAKDIITTMFLQTGNPITKKSGNSYISALSSGNFSEMEKMFSFYLSFSDPLKGVYSWNRSLPNSTKAFLNESLVFYFGYASEINSLFRQNPNLNFLITSIPQIRDSKTIINSGKLIGVAVTSYSKNKAAAMAAASSMANGDFGEKLSDALVIAPVKLSSLSRKPNDVFSPTFYEAAIHLKAWPDPYPEETNKVFKNMVDGVFSGSFSVGEAISDANAKLNFSLRK